MSFFLFAVLSPIEVLLEVYFAFLSSLALLWFFGAVFMFFNRVASVGCNEGWIYSGEVLLCLGFSSDLKGFFGIVAVDTVNDLEFPTWCVLRRDSNLLAESIDVLSPSWVWVLCKIFDKFWTLLSTSLFNPSDAVPSLWALVMESEVCDLCKVLFLKSWTASSVWTCGY